MLNQSELEQVKSMLDSLNQHLVDAGADSDQADWFLAGYSRCLQDLSVLFGSNLQNPRLN